LVTAELELPPCVRDGRYVADPARDVLKLAVIARHGVTDRIGLGFVHGFGFAAGALAQDDAPALNPFAPGGDDRQHASVELIADQTAITPGGVFLLGVTFDIEEGWHLYWDGKNDSGFPISVDLSLPEGFTREAIRWPAPVRKVSPGDIIAEIETDKATMEFEAVDEGVIGRILVAEGTEGVKVNTPIAVLLEEGEEMSEAAGAAAASGPPAGPTCATICG
jgi:hypothetical protein